MVIKRTRFPKGLEGLSERTILELALLRCSGTKRLILPRLPPEPQLPLTFKGLSPEASLELAAKRRAGVRRLTLPSLAHCLTLPWVVRGIRHWFERHLSERLGYPIRFRNAESVRRFLLATNLPPMVKDEGEMLRVVFGLEPAQHRVWLYLAPLIRIFVFRDWHTYLDCVAARLRHPLPDNQKHYADPARPKIRHGWKEMFRETFPDDTRSDRTLLLWAKRGRETLDRHEREIGFWIVIREPRKSLGSDEPRARWFEHIQVRLPGHYGDDFVAWEPGHPSHFGYRAQFDVNLRRPS